MNLKWIAPHLAIGSWAHVPNLLGAKRNQESLKSENGHLRRCSNFGRLKPHWHWQPVSRANLGAKWWGILYLQNIVAKLTEYGKPRGGLEVLCYLQSA